MTNHIYRLKAVKKLYKGTDYQNTRTGNQRTTVKNVKIDLLFLSPFPQKLMKSFHFFCKSQIIIFTIVFNYQILKMSPQQGVKSPIPGMTPKFRKLFLQLQGARYRHLQLQKYVFRVEVAYSDISRHPYLMQCHLGVK